MQLIVKQILLQTFPMFLLKSCSVVCLQKQAWRLCFNVEKVGNNDDAGDILFERERDFLRWKEPPTK